MRDFVRRSLEKNQPYYEDWHRFYRLFRGYVNFDYGYRSYRVLPIAFSTIMSSFARLIIEKPEFLYLLVDLPDNLEDEAVLQGNGEFERREILEVRDNLIDMVNYITEAQADRSNLVVYFMDSFLLAHIYGTSIIYTYWDNENNCPAIETVEPYNFFQPYNCTDPLKMKECAYVEYMTIDDFKSLYDTGFFNIKLPEGVELKQLSVGSGGTLEDHQSVKMAIIHKDHSNEDMVEVIHFYTSDFEYSVVGDLVVREHENPTPGVLPFVIHHNIRMPHEFHGISDIDHIEEMIEQASDLNAARMENLELTQHNMWLIDENANIDENDLVTSPHQIIRTNGPPNDSIVPFKTQPLSQDVWQQDEYYRRQIRETVSMSEYSQGATPERHELATTVNTLTDATNVRINVKAAITNNTVFKEVAKRFLMYNQLFYEPETIIIPNMKNDRGRPVRLKITKEMLKMLKYNYDTKVISGNAKNAEKRSIIELFQVITQSEYFMDMLDRKETLHELFKLWDFNAFKMIKSDRQMADEREQQQAMIDQQKMQEMAQQRLENDEGKKGGGPEMVTELPMQNRSVLEGLG